MEPIICLSLCQEPQLLIKVDLGQMCMCLRSIQMKVPWVSAFLSVLHEVCNKSKENHLVDHIYNQTYTFLVLKIIWNIQNLKLDIFGFRNS